MATKKKKPRDVNANVHRIFGEIISRSEKKPNRGSLQPVERNKGAKATSGGKKRP